MAIAEDTRDMIYLARGRLNDLRIDSLLYAGWQRGPKTAKEKTSSGGRSSAQVAAVMAAFVVYAKGRETAWGLLSHGTVCAKRRMVNRRARDRTKIIFQMQPASPMSLDASRCMKDSWEGYPCAAALFAMPNAPGTRLRN